MISSLKPVRLFILLVILFIRCDRKNDPNPAHSPKGIFETVWNDFDRNYPYFNHKHIDWDSVNEVYSPLINDNISSAELFTVIGEMTLLLKDLHVNITSSYGTVHFSKKENYPKNSPENAHHYLSSIYLENDKAIFGNMENAKYSYLRIKTFSGSVGDFVEAINSLDSLENKDGFIIDIRDNGGGNELNGRTFAGRFSEAKTLYKYTRIRNGSGWDEFTDWQPSYFLPNNSLSYDKKIIMLTNRSVYSSAELFVLMIKTYPNLILVGDTTGGASANPSQKNLPNGWKYWVSTWQATSLDFEFIEDNGIPPDYYILNDQNSINEGKDLILEKAIELLSSQDE